METLPNLIRRIAEESSNTWEDLIQFIKDHESFSVSAGSLMHSLGLKAKKVDDSGFELYNSGHDNMLKVVKTDKVIQIKKHGEKGYYFNHAGTIYHIEAK